MGNLSTFLLYRQTVGQAQCQTPHLYSAFPSSSSEGPSLRYRLQTLLYPSKDTRKGKYHYFGEYRKGFLSAGGI